MQLLKQLFTTQVGLFSAVGIGIMLCMAVFFVWLFTQGTQGDAPHGTTGVKGAKDPQQQP